MVVELDPDKRDWEYDGDGAKIYKLEVGKGHKTLVDLDGGVPLPNNWIEQSNKSSQKMND
jgi:hypothetical protein